jgi:hypothetical protein
MEIFRCDKIYANKGVFQVVRDVFRVGIGVAKELRADSSQQSESWVLSVNCGGNRFALVVRVDPANAVKPP